MHFVLGGTVGQRWAVGDSDCPSDACPSKTQIISIESLHLLVSTTTRSGHRAWLGDRARVTELGGMTRREFDASHVRKELTWPPSPN